MQCQEDAMKGLLLWQTWSVIAGETCIFLGTLTFYLIKCVVYLVEIKCQSPFSVTDGGAQKSF